MGMKRDEGNHYQSQDRGNATDCHKFVGENAAMTAKRSSSSVTRDAGRHRFSFLIIFGYGGFLQRWACWGWGCR